jgi:hypothetical protein
MPPSKRQQKREEWVASGAPEVQERLREALRHVGVDLHEYTALVSPRQGPHAGTFQATILVAGADLDALIAALEHGAPTPEQQAAADELTQLGQEINPEGYKP